MSEEVKRHFMHYDSDGDTAGDDSGDAGAVMEMLVITVVMMVL